MRRYAVKTGHHTTTQRRYEYLIEALMWVYEEMEENSWMDFVKRNQGNDALTDDFNNFRWRIYDIETGKIIWTEPLE